MYIDAAFRLQGTTLPLDHGYALYAALSRELPDFHRRTDWGVHPVAGLRTGAGELTLTEASHLKIRLPARDYPRVLPLSGTTLEVDGHPVVIGVPEAEVLEPAHHLASRYVTIKGYHGAESEFEDAVRRQIARLDTEGEVEVHVGPRRVIQVKEHTIVGFAVTVEVDDPELSLEIQRHGLGGRRKMGAGEFIPRSNDA